MLVAYLAFKQVCSRWATPEELKLSARRAWQVKAWTIAWSWSWGARISGCGWIRFAASWRDQLSRLPYKIEYVDLRYPNGFAVRMPDYKPGRAPRPCRVRRPE